MCLWFSIFFEETLAALGFLGGIVAHLAAVGAGADGLAVETGGGGLNALADRPAASWHGGGG